MSARGPYSITRRTFIQRVTAAACTFQPTTSAGDQKTVRIESGVPQLFVDDYLIGEQKFLKRTLHQPKKDKGGQEPVLSLRDEFGATPATLEANGTIVFDTRLKKWVMYALAFAPSDPSPDRVRLYRFTSRDAMNWIKGDDGSPQRIQFNLKDVASGQSATNIDLFSCYYDQNDRQHPYKGWLFFANWGKDREGTYYVRSRDGIAWTRGPMVLRAGSRTIQQDGRTLSGSGDVSIFHHNDNGYGFLVNLRFASPVSVGPDNRLRSRAFLFTDWLERPIDLEQVKRVDLIPAADKANGDLPHDEYYASTAWRCGSHWLGGLKVWHGGGDYPYSAAGCAFLKFASSRDGLHWRKIPFPNGSGEPEVFLANGVEGGNGGRNDGGYMTEFSQGPIRVGNELIYYYGCSSYGKNKPRTIRVSGGGIFRARMRPEGFVSVDAGVLTTKPLEAAAYELLVNGIGPIAVEVLDSAGKIRGSTLIRGDSLRHRVRFAGKPLGETISRGSKAYLACRLRFTVHERGRLYAFTVGPEAPATTPKR